MVSSTHCFYSDEELWAVTGLSLLFSLVSSSGNFAPFRAVL